MVGTGAVGSDLIDRTSIRRRGPVRRIAGVAGAILIVALRRRVGRPARHAHRRRRALRHRQDPHRRGRDPRSGRPGRHRQRRDLRPAVRGPDRLRPAAPGRGRRSPRRGTSSTAARRIVFHLRPDLTFSRRLADHRRRTSSGAGSGSSTRRTRRRCCRLIGDVEGALAYAHGENADPAIVGLTADGARRRGPPDPAARPTSRRSSPARRSRSCRPASTTDPRRSSPAGVRRQRRATSSQSTDDTTTTLTANDHYWAGPPAIPTIQLVHDIGGRSPVAGVRGRRRRPDRRLPVRRDVDRLRRRRSGRSSAQGASLSLELLRLRHDAAAVRRRPGPPGLRPGRRLAAARRRSSPARPRPSRRAWSRRASRAAATRTSCPAYDPDGARDAPRRGRLSGRRGLPETTFMTFGAPYDAAVRRRDQARARGRRSATRSRAATTSTGSPTIRRRSGRWAGSPTTRARTTSSGILLGDRVVEQLRPLESTPTSTRRSPTALATTDPAAARAAFDTAEGIVRDEAPVIPLSLRRRVDAVADRAARAQRERPRDHPHGGAGVGADDATSRRDRARRRIAASGIALSLAVASLLVVVAPAVAADPVDVRHADRVLDLRRRRSTSSSRSTLADGRPSGSSSCLRRPARPGPSVIDVDAPTPVGPLDALASALDLADGHIVPNTTFVARWRVTDADGKTWLGPPVSADLRRRRGSTGRR